MMEGQAGPGRRQGWLSELWAHYTLGADFKIHKTAGMMSPIIAAGEVSLVRDHNAFTNAFVPTLSTQEARLQARVVDASDRRALEKDTDVSNGYAASSWHLSTDATISLFQGSQLVAPYWAQYTSSLWQGRLSQTFPVGSYSCMIRHPRFYTAFFRVCDIPPEGLDLGTVALDPILNPGDREMEADWQASPNAINHHWGDSFA